MVSSNVGSAYYKSLSQQGLSPLIKALIVPNNSERKEHDSRP